MSQSVNRATSKNESQLSVMAPHFTLHQFALVKSPMKLGIELISSIAAAMMARPLKNRFGFFWAAVSQLQLTACLWITALSALLAINLALTFPDINDFRGLGAICRLMDANIGYCVNINWGFAHPLSCWLMTQLTGDLFVSQRLLNALFFLLYVLLLIRMIRRAYGGLSGRIVACVIIFICSPWMAEAAVSTHLDIVPTTMVFAAVSLIFQRKFVVVYTSAGILAGVAYWFRFHFLLMALLLPLLAGIIGKEKKIGIRSALATAAGVLSAISVPHLLSLLVYGNIGVSNARFVVAEAFGVVDWSYQWSVKLQSMSIIELLRMLDMKRFVMASGYHLITSGIFPLLLIAGIAVMDRFSDCGCNFNAFFNGRDGHGQMILWALTAGIAILPFAFLRGFTYRLEEPVVLCAIPMVAGMVSGRAKKTERAVFLLVIFCIAIQHVRYWPVFQSHKRDVAAIERIVSRIIPADVLANRPDNIICCVEYYNPYNKYKLCNPIICGGWGVRSGPMIERFGLLDLMHPFENRTYASSEYLVLPRKRDVFNYTEELLIRNRVLYKDNKMIIIQRK